MLEVQGTKVRYKIDQDGPQVSDDGGKTWRFTFRSEDEFREMWQNHPIVGTLQNNEDEDRELFGDTLDDPIPDDLWEWIK